MTHDMRTRALPAHTRGMNEDLLVHVTFSLLVKAELFLSRIRTTFWCFETLVGEITGLHVRHSLVRGS